MKPAEGSSAVSTLVRLAAGMTVLEFIWNSDRWRHEVRTSGGRAWRSVEGSAGPNSDPRWPASPVLTEVSLVEVAGRTAVLGLGLAGRSHFSLCVTVHPVQADTLLFEAACRIHSTAGWIGSSYNDTEGVATQIEPPGHPPDPPATVLWSYTVGPDGPRALELPSTGGAAAGG